MTKTYYKNSLKFDVLTVIEQAPDDVVLRKDIVDLGSPRQISRCLKDLIDMGKLVKIGYGVYVKTEFSKYLNAPVMKISFGEACKKALEKLGVDWQPGSAEEAYNKGLSTQVPMATVVRLKSRFRKKLSYKNKTLIVENGIYAR